MAYAALDAIDDAIDATKAFLLPFDRGQWLRLAVIMVFVAGGSGANVAANGPQFAGDSADPGTAPATEAGGALPDAALIAIVAVVGVAILVGLFFLFASPIMEFVFVQSLFEREVHVRQYFRDNVGNGLRLLGFQLAVGLVGLILIGIPFALLVLGLIGGIGTGAAAVGLFLLAIPFFVVYGLISGLINGLTRVFVVPTMLAEERGLLSAWGRVWSAMTDDLAQFLVYVVVSVVLGIGVGIVAGFAALFVLLVLAIPFGIVAFGVYAVGGFGVPALVVYAVLGVIAFVLYLVGVNLIQVPLQSFLRYYAMLVLGDIAPDLDPIPDIRAEIRDESV